jgi:arylsulfatase A-like enzyme
MKAIPFFSTLLLLSCLSLSGRSPSVVVILTDDQGWGDLSINGNQNLSTPNIDRLGKEGLTLENFYVCQVCAPTRAEFLTGRYYPKTGVSGVSRGEGRLNTDETTIADVFKKSGYATGAFGKWHNGTQPPYHPNYRGFDEYYGFTSGHWGHYFSPPLDHNGVTVRGNGYVVDDFTDKALEFIEANQERPFFCYLPYNTPHSPMQIDDRFYDKFENAEIKMRYREPEKEDLMMTRAALAMCENIDWNVGRVLSKLDELELADNTIVLFFTDNGPNSFRWNGGMKGRKGAIDEGGLRSPFLMRWPKKISAGRSIETLSGAIDLLPTLADLAGIGYETRHPIDGRSLLPLIENPNADWEERSLLSIKSNQVSVRTQRFRLDHDGALFDIENDRGQRSDVSSDHPEIVSALRALAEAHKREMTKAFEANRDRPFTVGYATSTTLPARDGTEHGHIQRSVRAPNNSFFTNWIRAEDSITWPADVVVSGEYEATVFYTCQTGNEGCEIRLSSESSKTDGATVTKAFDPPFYDKSIERMPESHYWVKEFMPLPLGTLNLRAGEQTLKLEASRIPGKAAIDVHSIRLVRQDSQPIAMQSSLSFYPSYLPFR